jgi:molybdopterin synthase catalytic subunit
MANAVCIVLVTEAALQNPHDEVVDASAGAVVDFWGVVRKLEDGCEITGIEYETHQVMAEHQMQRIAAEAIEKFGLNELLLHHRIGFVRAGEASLFLRVRASRRAAAFEASEWIVDDLKGKVPIWKKPVFSMPQGPAANNPSQAGIAAPAPK